AEDLPPQRLRCREAPSRRECAVEKPRLMQLLVLGKQAPQVSTESRIACTEFREPGVATFARQLEGLVEVRAERAPAIGAECRHEASWEGLRLRRVYAGYSFQRPTSFCRCSG